MSYRQKTTVSIQNFGPIKDITINLSQTTIVTGAQATGKSTVAKVVYFCKTIKDEILKQFSIPGGTDYINSSLENGIMKRLRGKFLGIFGSTWAMSMDMWIRCDYSSETWVEIYLEKDRKDKSKNYVSFKFSNSIKDMIFRLEQLSSTDPENINTARTELAELFQDDSECIYIPAGRGMITLLTDQLSYIFSGDEAFHATIDRCTQNYVNTILRLRPQFANGTAGLLETKLHTTQEIVDQKRLNELSDLTKKIIKGEYIYNANEERLRIDNNKYVKINYASSGQQESVWILNMMYYYILNRRKTFLIIEEPEAHLYPDGQKWITQAIGLFANADNQVFITTHSPYILGEFNNLLYAGNLVRQKISVDSVLMKEQVLDPQTTNGLYITNGICENAIEDGLFRNELIDGASMMINDENDRLMEILWDNKKA